MSGIHLALLGMSFGGGLRLGDPYEGGFFAGQISTAGNGVPDYNLVVAPNSSGEVRNACKTSSTATSGTQSLFDGPANTAAMIAAGAASHPAADFCNNLTIGGFSDWYLPASNELDIAYFGLKPSTTLNATSGLSGINANAVPPRPANYTTTVPGQTSATDFKSTGSEPFRSSTATNASNYWSSTENALNTTSNLAIRFSEGLQFPASKNNTAYYARAFRRVAL
jgi:hypothetical protein